MKKTMNVLLASVMVVSGCFAAEDAQTVQPVQPAQEPVKQEIAQPAQEQVKQEVVEPAAEPKQEVATPVAEPKQETEAPKTEAVANADVQDPDAQELEALLKQFEKAAAENENNKTEMPDEVK